MKSPIKDKPLRNPGQSLDNQILDLVFDEVLIYYVIALLLTILGVLEWWRWYNDSLPNPILFTVLAVVSVVVALIKMRYAKDKYRNLSLGRDGEKAVGQFLDTLRVNGYEVFHDIPGNDFNVDHVIVHQSGVYVIETKTWSKPDRGKAELIYNGDTILRFGRKADRDPIVQVKSASSWIFELVKTSTGRSVPVRGVVLFPGWFIESTAEGKKSDVWVLNPKALPAFIENSKLEIKFDDVKLIAYHISRYIRTEKEA